MTLKLILLAVATLAPVAFKLWRKYGSRDAEIRELRKKRKSIRRKMRQALHQGRVGDYESLKRDRLHVTREIASHTQRRKKGVFFGR